MTMTLHPVYTSLLAAVVGMLLPLTASADLLESQADLQAWMEDVRKHATVQALPLKEPKPFVPFRYQQQDKVDPFNTIKVTASSLANNPNNGDDDRRKEALEAFPMDAIRMVGTIERGGKRYGLLQVDQNVYQVQAGNYVGQNLGKVSRITERAIDIVETLPDENKGWTSRKVRLELQESEK